MNTRPAACSRSTAYLGGTPTALHTTPCIDMWHAPQREERDRDQRDTDTDRDRDRDTDTDTDTDRDRDRQRELRDYNGL